MMEQQRVRLDVSRSGPKERLRELHGSVIIENEVVDAEFAKRTLSVSGMT
jgi:hypothetical protein